MGLWGILLGVIGGLVFDLVLTIPLLGEAEPTGYLIVLVVVPVLGGYAGHKIEEGRS